MRKAFSAIYGDCFAVESESIGKSKVELLAYDVPITKLLEANSVKAIKEKLMNNVNIGHMFQGLHYTKTASELKPAMSKKLAKVEKKIKEREKRIVDLRREYAIDDAALIQLLTEARKNTSMGSSVMNYSYSVGPQGYQGSQGVTGAGGSRSRKAIEPVERVVGAGVVQNLLTEMDNIDEEKDQVKRLKMILRNLRPLPNYAEGGKKLPDAGFPVNYQDLEYLDL